MARKDKTVIDRQRVLDALAAQPGATKRDLVRLLNVKGSDRIILKRVLKEMAQDGLIEGTRKRGFAPPGALPPVAVLEIVGPDDDGELVARPMNWEGDDEPPKIFVSSGEDAPPGIKERVLARLTRHGEEYDAKIIRRLGTDASRILGVVRMTGGEARLAPVDKKAKSDLSVDARNLNGAKENELVLAEPLPGRRARVLERLGDLDAPKSISLIAIHAHGIPCDFPADAVIEAKSATPADLNGREDLRGIPLVTIDPEDARDFDDAVFAKRDGDGYQCIVAIADVAHYVTPGSALDKEAYKRGNSVYFPDKVVPMLPEELSTDLCSLRPSEDRACMAVKMHFDAGGKLRKHKFVRGMMRSAARLTYAQAQAAFDGKLDDVPAAAHRPLADLWIAYAAMAKARKNRDPLDLDLPERRIKIGDDGKVSAIGFKDRLESMKLIEEFMVMANVAAAETLEKLHQPLIYRIHEEPSKEKLHAFADYMKVIGFPFAKGQVMQPALFNRILEKAKGTPHELTLNDVVLRAQAQAVYFAQNLGHFGLHLAKYAHFTSPIRRYADLIVHRALIKALKLGDDGLSENEEKRLIATAEHISGTERRAMAAERDSTDRYVAAYMQDRVGATFAARIVAVTRFGLFVRLADTGAEGLLPARSLGSEFFHHDERKQVLIGERTRTTYALGGTVAVRLAEATPLTGGLRFELAEAETPKRRSATPLRPRSKRRR